MQSRRFWCPECVIITCEKCFSAEDVTYQRLPDLAVLYMCSRSHGGEGPHAWIKSVSELATPDEQAAEGVTDELLEPLSACVDPGDPFVEYGIVEYRLRQRYPDLFLAHVRDRGHVILGPKAYTASSVRFGVALGRLAQAGELTSKYGPATGAWRYNSQITYWARPPVPDQSMLTWADYCEALGRSSMWTDEDRAALRT